MKFTAVLHKPLGHISTAVSSVLVPSLTHSAEELWTSEMNKDCIIFFVSSRFDRLNSKMSRLKLGLAL